MSILTTLANYFETLAEEYKPIGHNAPHRRYFRNTKAAITVSDVPPGLLMYFSPVDMAFREDDGSATRQPAFSVTVLRSYEPKNYADMDSAYDQTYDHCEQLLARITEDRREGSCLFSGFAIDDAQIAQEDPFWDGWVGCTLLLRLQQPTALATNPALWENDDDENP